MSRRDNNLNSLGRHHPQAFQIVENSEPSSSVLFEESSQGHAVAKVSLGDKEIYLHSRRDPKKEASRFIEGQDVSKIGLVMVYGFACGYHIEALMLQLHPKAKAIVIEPDATLFSAVLEQRDFSSLFADKRLSLMVGLNPQQMFKFMEPRLIEVFLGMKIVTHEVSYRYNKELFQQASEAVKNFIEYGTTSLYTAASITAQSKFNAFMNMPRALYNPGIEHLKDSAKGKAAVVIGAGPSLSKNIELLKGAPVITIATGTILKRLLSEGIVPHAVCHIDYHFALTKKYFQDLPPLPNTLLLMDSRASYKTADMYPGPIATWDDYFMSMFLKELRPSPHGHIPPGATVSQTCYYLARFMGCDPIIFVGQDLAYPGHLTHMPGTAIYDNWWAETNRFRSMEDKEWEYFARIKKNLFMVKAIGGGEIYTDRQMYTYIQYFKQLFEEHEGRVIDACEQGAYKEHAEHMSFAEALKQDFIKVDKDFSLLAKGGYDNTQRRDEIVAVFDEYLKEAERNLEFYDRCISTLEELDKVFDNKAKRKKLLDDVDKLKAKFNSYNKFTSFINELTQSDDFQKQKDDLALALGNYEGEELQQRQLQRDHRFMKGLRGGILYFKEFILNGRRRLVLYPETESPEIITELDMIKEMILKNEN